MTSAEQLHGDESVMQQNTIRAQSNLQVAAEQQTRKKREMKEKTSPPAPFNLNLLLAGILLNILLALAYLQPQVNFSDMKLPMKCRNYL
jgi:hypothetical protein